MKPRYLTKSRFKLGMECPAKLFYTAKTGLYYDNKVDNDFLKALAEGGFQVGELAKRYYPGGTEIESLDYEEALLQTNALMEKENVIIYEAAFRFDNLFIRADVVVKNGDRLDIIEVKAKSIDGDNESFTKKDGSIQAKWKAYLEDIAFQKYVVQKAYPILEVRASLMLTDKTKTASIDGLNQMFFLYKDEGRNKCKYTGPDEPTALGMPILKTISVEREVDIIYNLVGLKSFEHLVESFAKKYERDEKIAPLIGGQCGKCEFKLEKSMKYLNPAFMNVGQNRVLKKSN